MLWSERAEKASYNEGLCTQPLGVEAVFLYRRDYPEWNYNFLSDRSPEDLWWIWPMNSIQVGEEEEEEENNTPDPIPVPVLASQIMDVKTGYAQPDSVPSFKLARTDSVATALAKLIY